MSNEFFIIFIMYISTASIFDRRLAFAYQGKDEVADPGQKAREISEKIM